MTGSDLFTERHVRVVEIVKIEGGAITFDDGWTFGGVPERILPRLETGVKYLVETRQVTYVTGMATCYLTTAGDFVVDQWFWHKSDLDLKREHDEMMARIHADHLRTLEENREDWARREAALPEPLRRRLERFRANAKGAFDADGWGYELVVSELTVLYAASDQQETEEIEEYARREGTSGNQHDYAKALSRYLNDDLGNVEIVANESISALTPITGDKDYSGLAR